MAIDKVAIAAIVSGVASVASGVSSFVTSRKQAKVQEQQAAFARKQAKIDAEEFRRRQRRILGQARAARGASGVDLLTGSPLLVDDDTIAEIEFGAARIERGGEVEGTRLEQQAGFTRAAGTGALIGGIADAGGTLLTSGAFDSNRTTSGGTRFGGSLGSADGIRPI